MGVLELACPYMTPQQTHYTPPLPTPQYDVHLPLLTVKETLEFAHAALWASGCKNDLGVEFGRVGGWRLLGGSWQAPLQRRLDATALGDASGRAALPCI